MVIHIFLSETIGPTVSPNLSPQKPTHSLRQSVEYIHTESTGEDHIETHREEHEFIDQSQEGP